MLDIIVTHYKEPWGVGRKFFDMIGCQQAIKFDDINVVLVHDGTALFPADYFYGYPFKVTQYSVPHGGVSAARNFGMDKTNDKWVMFCDFDDMFSNAFALKTILQVLNTKDFDLLWTDFYSVDKDKEGNTYIDKRGENIVFVHGKVFRREWLKENGLRFDPELTFNEDCLFCSIAMETIPIERIGHIETEFPAYVWCYTPKSATADPDNWAKATIGGYQRNKKILKVFEGKDPERYDAMVARLVWDAYNSFNLENFPDELKPYLDDFREFYKEHKMGFWMTDVDIMQEVKKISCDQFSQGEFESMRRWGINPMKRTKKSIKAWLGEIEKGVES